MKRRYLAINEGPSQTQEVQIEIPHYMAIAEEEIRESYILQAIAKQLKPNAWTTIDPAGISIKELNNVPRN